MDTSYLQTRLDERADAKLKADVEAALPEVKGQLHPKYTPVLIVDDDGAKKSVDVNSAIRRLRKVVTEANRKRYREEETLDFLKSVLSLEEQMEELNSIVNR